MNINWRALIVAVVVAIGSMVAGFAAAAEDAAVDTWTEAVNRPNAADGTESVDPPEAVEPPAADPAFDCREVEAGEVCDTFGESDEGPGTR